MSTKLQENYLPEDIYRSSDELVNVQKNCIKLLNSALEAQFTEKDRIIAELDQGMKVLEALNQKKLKREEHKHHEYARRHWF
ncbi:hypothetical protein YPHTV1_00007 [Halomonas phage YPHTV-1]|nr:hypothetical protein YPHTV1_00007 [Halomonas phage YPHTV-1]